MLSGHMLSFGFLIKALALSGAPCGWTQHSRSLSLLQVEQSKVLIKEGGVQLLLTIVDTPGFGDAVDNSNW